jgi:hypothetical protein
MAEAIMTTVSGLEINLLNFKKEDIRITDVAHALSQINRFGGHAPFPVSVAKHSCNLVPTVPAQYRKAAFAHDWSEAYVNDLVSGLKAVCPDYQQVEDAIQMVIFDALDIPWEHMQAIHHYDKAIGRDEWRQLFHPNEFPIETTPLEETTWRDDKYRFLQTYKELFA